MRLFRTGVNEPKYHTTELRMNREKSITNLIKSLSKIENKRIIAHFKNHK